MSDPRTDREVLRDEAYVDDSALAKRRAIWMYRRPSIDFVGTAIDLARFEGDECVLDAGCGPGTYLERLVRLGHRGPLIGSDLSMGMVRAAARHAPATCSDTAALALTDGAADAALAMHTLYHLPDIDRGIAELRRVVRPGGTLLVSTNGAGHVAELSQLLVDAVRDVTGVEIAETSASWRFRLEVAADRIRPFFPDVVETRLPGILAVPDVDRVVDYVDSLVHFQSSVPDGTDWRSVLARARSLAAAVIARHGAFTASTAVGVLRCR